MYAAVAEVLDFFDTNRARLEEAVAAVPVDLHARRPGAEQWSVAEILAHLAIVERRVLQLLISSIEAAASAGLAPEAETILPVVPTVNVARLVDRSRRVATSEASMPPADADARHAMRDLAETRTELRRLLLEFAGQALSTVVVPNPVLGPVNVYQSVVFLAAHEARHTQQIHEARASLVPHAP